MKKMFLVFVAVFAMIFTACSSKGTTVSSQTTVDSNRGAGANFEDLSVRINRLNNSLDKVYFDFDKFDIRSDMQAVINTNANIFNTEVNSASITVEGNCDEWGSDEYNQALGLKRAKAVKDALVVQGVDANRIAIKSFGETNPVCTEKGKACDAQNRRAEFKLAQ